MKVYTLPILYENLHWTERKEVREQYITEQQHKCLYCKCDLRSKPSQAVRRKKIDWELFPPNFLKYPVHLQHNHITGLTEGAVHSLCNAVLWQYEGK